MIYIPLYEDFITYFFRVIIILLDMPFLQTKSKAINFSLPVVDINIRKTLKKSSRL